MALSSLRRFNGIFSVVKNRRVLDKEEHGVSRVSLGLRRVLRRFLVAR